MKPRPYRSDTSVILVLSGAISVGILPFLIMRFVAQTWSMFFLDLFAISVTTSLFVYVWLTGRTQLARWVIAVSCLLVMTMTIYLKGYSNMMWVYPALSVTTFLLRPIIALIASIGFLCVATLILWPELTALKATQFIVTAITTLSFCFVFAHRSEKLQQELTQLATHDSLTGVGNRRALEEDLINLIHRLERYPDHKASLLMFDLDRFKAINDEHGHGHGDEVLKNVAQIVEQRIRANDAVYRYGGEEFVVIAENTSQEDAVHLAESLRSAMARHSNSKSGPVTMSVGVAEYRTGESHYAWLERADMALYEAKAAGRNTVRTGAQTVT